jgi:acetate kinase
MRILVLNPGSSTLKATLVTRTATGDTDGPTPTTIEWPPGDEAADEVVARALEIVAGDVDAVGYRVVHGGSRYQSATRVDEGLVAAVRALDALAPLHNRRAAAVMLAGLAAGPGKAHVACFDTAFHATLPEEAWRYALPSNWVERLAIRRYGFHGLSVAWSTRRAAAMLARPIEDLGMLVAHLGSGCSVTAVQGGRSVDTSMGWTPFEGLIMGTRAGSIDPGILVHLVADGIEPTALAEGLARRSGLLAVGGTHDVRDLEHRAAGHDARARMALDMFARHAAAAVAAASTALDRLDALVFTGGIGEHAGSIRSNIVARLGVLGFPDALRDAMPDAVLAAGPPSALVIGAREDLVIAEEVAALLGGDEPPPDP